MLQNILLAGDINYVPYSMWSIYFSMQQSWAYPEYVYFTLWKRLFFIHRKVSALHYTSPIVTCISFACMNHNCYWCYIFLIACTYIIDNKSHKTRIWTYLAWTRIHLLYDQNTLNYIFTYIVHIYIYVLLRIQCKNWAAHD